MNKKKWTKFYGKQPKKMVKAAGRKSLLTHNYYTRLEVGIEKLHTPNVMTISTF